MASPVVSDVALSPSLGPHVLDPEVYSRVGEMQGYALHGHVDLHMWHAHVCNTGTSVQYILPVPWSRDCTLPWYSCLVEG